MLLRGKETLLWLFVMPILFFYFIGTVTSRMGGAPSDVPDVIDVERGDEAGFLADRLEVRLEARGFRLAEAGEKVSRRLVLPPRFTASVLAGEPVSLELVNESEGLGREFDELRVGRAVYGLLAETVAAREPTVASLAALDEISRTLSVSVESAGERRRIPTGFEQAVPGIMVMFTLLVLLSSGAAQLVVEREQGLLRRLASTPIPRGSVVPRQVGRPAGPRSGPDRLCDVRGEPLVRDGLGSRASGGVRPDVVLGVAVCVAGSLPGRAGANAGPGGGDRRRRRQPAGGPRRLLVADRDHP